MTTHARVENAISRAVEDLNEQLPADGRVSVVENTTLLGPDGRLDSLGLVNLAVLAEQAVEHEFQTPVSLADEFAKPVEENPFRSPAALVEHIVQMLGPLERVRVDS